MKAQADKASFDILKIKEKLLPFFQKREDVVAVYLFGSQAERVASSLSDIDLAVLFKTYTRGTDHFHERLVLMKEIGEILATDRVDICPLTLRMSLPLAEQIFRHGTLLFSRNEAMRTVFEMQMRDKIFDFHPIQHTATIAMEERMAKGTYGYRS